MKRRERRTPNLRKLINSRLRRIGRTPYWLSKRQTTVHPATCRLYLRGRRDTTGEAIGELMQIVGLKVCRAGLVPRIPMRRVQRARRARRQAARSRRARQER